MSTHNSVPAVPDTGYFSQERQRNKVAAEAGRARAASVAAEQAGATRACVAAEVPGRVQARLGAASHALWRAAAELNLAGLGESQLYRDIEAAAVHAEQLQQRIAVQMYA